MKKNHLVALFLILSWLGGLIVNGLIWIPISFVGFGILYVIFELIEKFGKNEI